MSEPVKLIYCTVDSQENARQIVQSLIDEKLIACANILPNIQSIYRWQGDICYDQEVIIISKCQQKHLAALMERLKSIHPYDCPCIVAMDLDAVEPDYLKWLIEETKS